jgi:hypothetical protein
MEAAGINDSGQIVGSGAKADGVHAFRLDPISEHEKRHRRSHERDDDEPARPTLAERACRINAGLKYEAQNSLSYARSVPGP